MAVTGLESALVITSGHFAKFLCLLKSISQSSKVCSKIFANMSAGKTVLYCSFYHFDSCFIKFSQQSVHDQPPHKGRKTWRVMLQDRSAHRMPHSGPPVSQMSLV